MIDPEHQQRLGQEMVSGKKWYTSGYQPKTDEKEKSQVVEVECTHQELNLEPSDP
jgi:hypothetical protein